MERRRFSIGVRAPFRLDLTAWALRRRPDNAVDRWDGHAYQRVLVFGDEVVQVRATQVGRPERSRLEVTLVGRSVDESAEQEARRLLTRTRGLEVDLSAFYRLAEGDAFLRPLAARFRGLKPPRFPSVFECLVNAVACQQLTLTVGIRLLNRLAAAYGAELLGGHAFPRPADLADVRPEALRPLGFSRAKARSIIGLAEAARELADDELEALP